jgi:hypothetical protein
MPKGHAGVNPRDTNQLKPQIDPALTAPAAPAARRTRHWYLSLCHDAVMFPTR